MSQATPAAKLKLGTRASALARWQADWVAGQLTVLGVEVGMVPIRTQGDAQQTGPIGAIGSQGVFTKEIQRALLAGEIDIAVHSLKDLPTDPVAGLMLAAVPAREAVDDVLVNNNAWTLDTLPEGAVVGTGSTRRQAQLRHARPDLEMRDIRGNVDTRLRKLDEGQYDAIVLAVAGLRRLRLTDRIGSLLPKKTVLPAVGQGALGIECRANDLAVQAALNPLDDAETHQAVLAERALLAALRGGCLAPVGAWARLEQDVLRLEGRVLSLDGTVCLAADLSAPSEQAVDLGERVAALLIEQGAREVIDGARDF